MVPLGPAGRDRPGVDTGHHRARGPVRRALQSGLLLLAGVLTLIWFHRVYVNAGRFGSLLPHTPGWAVGSWLVPFLNLVRPPRMVSQAWRASDPALVAGNVVAWSAAPRSRLVPFWWAAWLLSAFSGAIASGMSDSDQLSTFRSGLTTVLVSDALDAVAALLFAVLVWRLTARQTQRIADLHG